MNYGTVLLAIYSLRLIVLRLSYGSSNVRNIEIFLLQGNPIHALGESISFGRFMSESLAWDKWSSFSQNRYLEEVEKYSKPGSVAQKKAYFEAHYKRIAAKKAAALLEQENAAANISQPEIADQVHNSVALNTELVGCNSHVTIDEPQEVKTSNTESSSITDTNGCNFNVGINDLETTKVEGADLVIKDQLLEENLVLVESSKQIEVVEKHNKVTEIELCRTTQMDKPPSKVEVIIYFFNCCSSPYDLGFSLVGVIPGDFGFSNQGETSGLFLKIINLQ